MRKTVVLMAAFGVFLEPTAAFAAPGDSVTLEIDRNFADPSFILAGGTYYAFATGNGFPVYSAPSMRGPWTSLGKAMPVRPSWTEQGGDWAPDVFLREYDGRFIMYYTAHDRATDKQCIGVATAATPAGPYTDPADHPRICPPNFSAIDPSPFTKADGTHWIVYAAPGAGIRATRMTADRTHNAGEPPITLIPNQPTIIEAPVIVRSGPRLVMFVSRNHTRDSCRYRTEVWWSSGLDGTWDLSWDVLSTALTGRCGPGGADLTKIDGTTWIMFHAWRCDVAGACDHQDPAADRHRAMFVGTIAWDATGVQPSVE